MVDPELRAFLDAFDVPEASAETLSQLRTTMAAPPAAAHPDVEVTERRVPGPPGAPDVRVSVYRPKTQGPPRPALLWLHGGGFVLGNPELDDAYAKNAVADLDCVVVSVAYRLAPETPFPGAIEDCYAALTWLHAEAPALGVDTARLAVGGASAGGGLAAALALLARDRGQIPLVFQLLVYPLLDDRTVTTPAPDPYGGKRTWSLASTRFFWTSLLGHEPGQAGETAYAAPARAEDLAGLAPAWIAVGSLDLHLEEDIEYARRLLQAGVPAELHVYPGAFHGFDAVKEATVSRTFERSRLGALRRAFQSEPERLGGDLEGIYRRYLASLNSRRFEELGEFVHDPIRFNGEVTSLADYAAAIQANIEAVPDFHWEIENIVAQNDLLAVRLTDTGTPTSEWLGYAPSGRAFSTHEFAVYRFRGGKVAEMWFLLDAPSVAAQLTGDNVS